MTVTRLREYVVTLKDSSDLESFYNHMETVGGSNGIPRRAVDCKDRRPISRSTHYWLYDSEAENLRKNPKVLSVELSLEEQGMKIRRFWSETSTLWNKSNTISGNHKNWGLLRCTEGEQRSNWGTGVGGVANVTGTAKTTSSGKNVDVVIVDGHFNPAHPEFAKNRDGTGGSRVIQYNWFQHNPVVTGGAPSTYVYTPYVDPSYTDEDGDGVSDRTEDNTHGAIVATIMCGSSQGWARDANIYNINPYSSSPSSTPYVIDYIRAFHRNKPVNPITGLKNPTVTNHSYGYIVSVETTRITDVRFRGTEFTGPFTDSQLINFGLTVDAGSISFAGNSTFLDQDCIDAMNEGIIFISAAGNQYHSISPYSTNVADDYNNYVIIDGFYLYYYMRGTITAPGVIVVGSSDLGYVERKATFSNTGPRVDLYSPGFLIMGAVNYTSLAEANSDGAVTVTDPRNTGYRFTKSVGTSFAAPQVAGAVACLAEQWPRMKSAEARDYIIQKAKTGQLTTTNGGFGDYTDLQGGENRFLYYYKDRPEDGMMSPKLNLGTRKSEGMTWPRPKIYRYGR